MSFYKMEDGTTEQWMQIGAEHIELQKQTPEAILSMLRQLENVTGGFAVNQLHHALQTATMAKRAGASDEIVLCALCHDIAKVISVPNHAQIAAEILKPYVSEDSYHIIRTHQDFQGKHYYQHLGKPTDLRLQYEDEPWYALAVQFTDEWDQAAFDPSYEVLPLEEFEPLVRQFFASGAL